MNTTTEGKTMKQVGFGFAVEGSMFALTVGSTVECFKSKRTAIVVEIYEAHCSGRIPVRAVDLETGADMMPFADECKVIRPYVGRAGAAHEVSQECAERWADYNLRGNGR